MAATLRRLRLKLNGHTGVAVLLVLFVVFTYVFTSYRLDQYREIMYEDRLQALQPASAKRTHKHDKTKVNEKTVPDQPIHAKKQHPNKKHDTAAKTPAAVGIPKIVQGRQQNDTEPKHPKTRKRPHDQTGNHVEPNKHYTDSATSVPRVSLAPQHNLTARAKPKRRRTEAQNLPVTEKSQDQTVNTSKTKWKLKQPVDTPLIDREPKQKKPKRPYPAEPSKLISNIKQKVAVVPTPDKKIARTHQKANQKTHQGGS